MKVSELVYTILDLAKAANSDDSYFTEEHVIFLAKNYRSFLLKKEHDKEKSAQDMSSSFEQQQICLDLEAVPAIDGLPCTGGYYLRSTKPIPNVLEDTLPSVYPIDFYQGIHISFIPKERMKYTGTNPYLRSIIYCSIGPDLHLYFNATNPQFIYLKQVRMSAVFEDFEQAAELLCDDSGASMSCDPLDMDFPMREHLVPLLIELVVKELTGVKYHPIDTRNDAKDDLPQQVKS